MSFEVPEILKGIKLYEQDKKLCQKLPFVLGTWAQAFPNVNIKDQIAWAAAWEVSNPTRQKKNRIRFLFNWMSRTQARNVEMFRPLPGEILIPKPALPSAPHYDVAEEDVMTGDDFARMREQVKRKGIRLP